jgi:hypothetical protein
MPSVASGRRTRACSRTTDDPAATQGAGADVSDVLLVIGAVVWVAWCAFGCGHAAGYLDAVIDEDERARKAREEDDK